MPVVTIPRPKDAGAALRMRKYRRRQKASRSKAVALTGRAAAVTTAVAAEAISSVTIDAAEMSLLVDRLDGSRASQADLRIAAQLIIELIDRLPPGLEIPVMLGRCT